jgi:hypothetical protein
MWKTIATTDEWMGFAEVALRLVSLAVSEAEVERVISVQRDIIGTKGGRTRETTLTTRTQPRQGYRPLK